MRRFALASLIGFALGAAGMWLWQSHSNRAALAEAREASAQSAELAAQLEAAPTSDALARIDAALAGDDVAAERDEAAQAAAYRADEWRRAIEADVRLSLPPPTLPRFDAMTAAASRALSIERGRADAGWARADSLRALLFDVREQLDLERRARIAAQVEAAAWRAAAESKPASVSLSIPAAGVASAVIGGAGFVIGYIIGEKDDGAAS